MSAQVFYPSCNKCGWRKGGLHSWNGRACKCGHTATPHVHCGKCNYTGLIAGSVCVDCSGSGLVPRVSA